VWKRNDVETKRKIKTICSVETKKRRKDSEETKKICYPQRGVSFKVREFRIHNTKGCKRPKGAELREYGEKEIQPARGESKHGDMTGRTSAYSGAEETNKGGKDKRRHPPASVSQSLDTQKRLAQFSGVSELCKP